MLVGSCRIEGHRSTAGHGRNPDPVLPAVDVVGNPLTVWREYGPFQTDPVRGSLSSHRDQGSRPAFLYAPQPQLWRAAGVRGVGVLSARGAPRGILLGAGRGEQGTEAVAVERNFKEVEIRAAGRENNSAALGRYGGECLVGSTGGKRPDRVCFDVTYINVTARNSRDNGAEHQVAVVLHPVEPRDHGIGGYRLQDAMRCSRGKRKYPEFTALNGRGLREQHRYLRTIR